MTSARHDANQRDRLMIDGIRELFGLEPLYGRDPLKELRDVERFAYVHPGWARTDGRHGGTYGAD